MCFTLRGTLFLFVLEFTNPNLTSDLSMTLQEILIELRSLTGIPDLTLDC
jgi:hypothetical protein